MIASTITYLFQSFIPTRVTPFGRRIFYITNENSHFARLHRTGQLYTRELDPTRATYERE